MRLEFDQLHEQAVHPAPAAPCIRLNTPLETNHAP